MAAAILERRLADRGVDVRVTSAGTRPWSTGATDEAIAVMREKGLDIASHENRKVTRELIESADLVLGMTRDHVAYALARCPDAADRSFLVGELVRLGTDIGPRGASEPTSSWAGRAATARPPRRPLGRAVDQIQDPAGQPIDIYRRTAAVLDDRLSEIAALLAGVPTLA